MDYLLYLFIFIAAAALKAALVHALLPVLLAGALATICAWAVEPYAARRLLFLVVPVASCAAAAQPGLLLATAAAALLVRSYAGDNGIAFAAGLLAGLALCVTPALWPLVVAGYGSLVLAWLRGRAAILPAAAGAGVFDVLGFVTAIHPPPGGFVAFNLTHVSLLYVTLGLAMLLGGVAIWRLAAKPQPRLRGSLVAAVLLLAWLALWLHDGGRLTWHGFAWIALGPALYAAWRATHRRGRAQWLYLACCLGLAGLADMTAQAAIALALLAPLAGSDLWLRSRKPAPKPPWER